MGYYFSQPTTHFRHKKNTISIMTSKVITQREWLKRLQVEKSQHDCQRRLYNEERKKQMTAVGCNTRCCGAALEDGLTGVPHIPTLMIMSPGQVCGVSKHRPAADFGLLPPAK